MHDVSPCPGAACAVNFSVLPLCSYAVGKPLLPEWGDFCPHLQEKADTTAVSPMSAFILSLSAASVNRRVRAYAPKRISDKVKSRLQILFGKDILEKDVSAFSSGRSAETLHFLRKEEYPMNSAFDTYFTSLKNKKIAVLGLGVSNRPLVRLLLEYGCDVVGCDRTPREKLDARFWNWKPWAAGSM